MKYFLFTVFVLLFHSGIFGQTQPFGQKPVYCLYVRNLQTGSEFISDMTICVQVKKDRRSLEMGMMYFGKEKRINGAEIKFTFFLENKPLSSAHPDKKNLSIIPIIHYHCLYRTLITNQITVPNKDMGNSVKIAWPSPRGTVAGVEHYVGPGLLFIFSKNIQIETSLGFGGYIGRVNHNNTPKSPGIHQENSGYTLAFDIGLGYSF